MRRRKRRDFWAAWHEEGRRAEQHGQERPQQWRLFFYEQMGSWPEEHWAIRGRRFQPWHQGTAQFNPFVASVLSKGGGLLPLLMLRLLENQPRYGNEIMDQIARATDEHWIANPGAVYPLLTQLEKQGLVAGQWEDPQKRTVRVYNLTDEGRKELGRLDALVRPKLEEAIGVMRKLIELLDDGEQGGSGAIVSM